MKGYRLRYFVLCAHELAYYATEEKFLSNPVNHRALKGTIDLREALEIRIPCDEHGLVFEETPMTRLKSNAGEPQDGEFQIVTPERIWQLRVLPEEVDDRRDLIRWVRALHASLDYYANDQTQTIYECLDEIIESSAIQQNTLEDSLIDKYQDLLSVIAEKDSRNHFLEYISWTLPEISELVSGYYAHILPGNVELGRSPDAKSLLQTFLSKSHRFGDHVQLDELTQAMRQKCSKLSMTITDLQSIVGEILRSPTVKLLFEKFLDSPKFKIFIWHHKSKTCINGEYDEQSRWPSDLDLRLQRRDHLRKSRMIDKLENLSDNDRVREEFEFKYHVSL